LQAIKTLGKLKAEGVVPQLGEILSQKRWIMSKKTKELQRAAAQALAEIATNEALALLG